MRTGKDLFQYCVDNAIDLKKSEKWATNLFNELIPHVSDDEQVLAAFTGIHNYVSLTNHEGNCAYIITNRRILINPEAPASGQQSFVLLSQINGVEMDKDTLTGKIHVQAADGSFNVYSDNPALAIIENIINKALNHAIQDSDSNHEPEHLASDVDYAPSSSAAKAIAKSGAVMTTPDGLLLERKNGNVAIPYSTIKKLTIEKASASKEGIFAVHAKNGNYGFKYGQEQNKAFAEVHKIASSHTKKPGKAKFVMIAAVAIIALFIIFSSNPSEYTYQAATDYDSGMSQQANTNISELPAMPDDELIYIAISSAFGDVQIINQLNSLGGSVGTRGWVSVDRGLMTDVCIVEFYYAYIRGSGHNFFTLDFGDGTGYLFPSSQNRFSHQVLDDTGGGVEALSGLMLIDNGEVVRFGEIQGDDSIPVESAGMSQAMVSRTINGDTVELSTGERVRLIGIDTPETGEPGASESTDFVRRLTEGQTVWLEADGNDTDVHGRLRRYVWLQEPSDPTDESQIRAYMLNAMLLEQGLADVMIVGNVRNADLFRRLTQESEPAALEAVAPTPEPAQAATMVWLSATGERWHTINNCGRMNPARATQVTLEYARASGRTTGPCNVCGAPD